MAVAADPEGAKKDIQNAPSLDLGTKFTAKSLNIGYKGSKSLVSIV